MLLSPRSRYDKCPGGKRPSYATFRSSLSFYMSINASSILCDFWTLHMFWLCALNGNKPRTLCVSLAKVDRLQVPWWKAPRLCENEVIRFTGHSKYYHGRFMCLDVFPCAYSNFENSSQVDAWNLLPASKRVVSSLKQVMFVGNQHIHQSKSLD